MSRFTAVVHDAQGARFVATAHSPRELDEHVVAYIRARCDYVLWSRTAARVRALIARDRKDAAIAVYFANVGQRWDAEWLELTDERRDHAPARRSRRAVSLGACVLAGWRSVGRLLCGRSGGRRRGRLVERLIEHVSWR